jgi:hypothetical protein
VDGWLIVALEVVGFGVAAVAEELSWTVVSGAAPVVDPWPRVVAVDEGSPQAARISGTRQAAATISLKAGEPVSDNLFIKWNFLPIAPITQLSCFKFLVAHTLFSIIIILSFLIITISLWTCLLNHDSN